MSGQAEQLQQTMSFFKLEGSVFKESAVLHKAAASGKKSSGSKPVPHPVQAPGEEPDETHFTKF